MDMYAVGTIVCVASADSPGTSWLPCDGRALATGEYAELQAALDSREGSDSAMRLPDYRGMRVISMPGLVLARNALLASHQNSGATDLSWWIKAR